MEKGNSENNKMGKQQLLEFGVQTLLTLCRMGQPIATYCKLNSNLYVLNYVFSNLLQLI